MVSHLNDESFPDFHCNNIEDLIDIFEDHLSNPYRKVFFISEEYFQLIFRPKTLHFYPNPGTKLAPGRA